MRVWLAMLGICAASALAAPAHAQSEVPQAAPQPEAPIADRLTLTANGSTLSAASGGYGESLGWLRSLHGGGMVGLGVQQQTLADARWTFASVNGALTRKSAAGRTRSFSAEIYRGSGEDTGRPFDYAVTALGVAGAVTDRLSLRFETREIDIDTTHGNLPKLGLSFLWNTHFLTDVAYAKSVSGNLGTELVSTRTDYFGERFRLLFGAAFGEAAPSVLNLQPGLALPEGTSSRQFFVGVSKPLERGELLAVADQLYVSGSERATLTISYMIPLRREQRSKQ